MTRKITLDFETIPLSVFLEDAEKIIAQLEKTGQPLILTIDGQPELVVQHIDAYQKLLDEVEQTKPVTENNR